MQLGTLLLRDGVIGLDDLESALRAQILHGGRLGTNLVEAGALDLATLGDYLARSLGIPLAPQDRFEDPSGRALELIPGELAAELAVCPLGFDDTEEQILALAMADPRDLDAVEALVETTGCAVGRYVAPELRVRYYVERHYGIPRAARFIRPAAIAGPPRRRSERRRTHPARGLELPPALRVTPRADRRHGGEGLRALCSSPAAASDSTPTGREPADERPAGAPPSPEPADERPAGAPPSPEPADERPAGAPPSPEPADERPAGAPPSPEPADERPAPIPLDQIVQAIEGATTREEVGDALERFAAGRLALLAILTVRDGNATGWRAAAGDGRPLDITDVAIPLGGSSSFQAAHDTGRGFRGAPPAPGRPAEGRLWEAAGIDEPPAAVAVIPVVVGERVVNLLYAHTTSNERLGGVADELAALAETVVETYLRLIRSAKQRRARS